MGARKYAGEVKSFNFSSFQEQIIQEKNYSFKNFNVSKIVDSHTIAHEHSDAIHKGFNINEEVKIQRGHAQYEADQYNIKIEEEVQKKILEIKEQISSEAYNEGLSRAKEEIELQFKTNFEQQVNDLIHFVEFVKKNQNEVLEKSKKDLLKVVQLLTHWILQKELNIDYVDKLIPLILTKVQEGQKILIKVDTKSFETLKEGDNLLQTKFSSFKNLRLLVDEHITHPGVIIETDSNIFDATQEAQKELIDSVFSSLMEQDRGSNS